MKLYKEVLFYSVVIILIRGHLIYFLLATVCFTNYSHFSPVQSHLYTDAYFCKVTIIIVTVITIVIVTMHCTVVLNT